MLEIEQRFGASTPRRVELFAKLRAFVKLSRSFALFDALFVDGSFVTDKDVPGDIDAVLALPRANLALLLQHPKSQVLLDLPAVRATYEVHLFFQPSEPNPTPNMAEFFQGLRPEEAIMRKLPATTKRGILGVTI